MLGIGVYFLSSRLERQKNVTLTSNTILRVHMGLQSVMDYVYYTIERRYCLSNDLLQAPNCQLNMGLADRSKNYTSTLAPSGARSIERIMLSDQQAANMVDMVNKNCVDLGLEAPYKPRPADASKPMSPTNCGSNIDKSFQKYVSNIDIITPATDINAAHPLFSVVDPLYRSMRNDLAEKDSTGRPTGKSTPINIHVRIARDGTTNSNVPVSGGEVYFTVKVGLEDQNGNLLTINNGTITLETSSYGTIFPRELGAFSLVVANNLWLDGTDGPAGDVSIKPQAGWLSSGGKGILFKSPVFINGDIHLPYASPSQGGFHGGAAFIYTPVTFGDRVIQGNGMIYAGATAPYVPQTAGGSNDAFWSDNALFGGFKMGVAVDNAFDKGLQMFASTGGGGSSYDAMQQCLTYQNAQVDPAAVNATALYGALTNTPGTGTGQTFEYTFGSVDPTKALPGNVNSMAFNPQTPPNGTATAGGSGTPFASATLSPQPLNNAVMAVKVFLGDPNKGTPQEADAYMSWGSTLTITPQLGSTTAAYQNLQTKSAAETDVNGPWHTALAAYTTAMAGPGTITIHLDPVTLPEKADSTKSDVQTHLVKMTITTTGNNTFYDANGTGNPADPGTFVAPVIDVLGFDARYNNFGVISQDMAQAQATDVKMHRRLKFTTDGTSLSPPVDSGGKGATLGPDKATDSWTSPITYNNPYDATSPFYDNFNYVELAAACQAGAGHGTNQSFGAAAWNIDFSTDSAAVRHSWDFANSSAANTFSTQGPTQSLAQPVGEGTCPPCPNSKGVTTDPCPLVPGDTLSPRYAMCSKDLTENDSSYPTYVPGSGPPPKRADFQPWSIVKDCTITRGAVLVAGFFVCDTLTIEDRTAPLTMIGTFIVKSLYVPPTALKAGITWMSIYNPDALAILRKSGILRTKVSGVACSDNITGAPIWDQSSPTVPSLQDFSSCNTLSLRSTAQPFQWTAFDPDCGVIPTTPPAPANTNTVCKRHPVNYFVMEQGRGGGP